VIFEVCTITTGRVKFSSIAEATNFINFYNGKDNVFMSIYYFYDEPLTFDNCNVNKIFIDLDPKEDIDQLMEDFQKLHYYLEDKKLKHRIVFSGGGFHFYIYIKNCFTAAGLYKSTKWIIEDSEIGDSYDKLVVGDYRRVARVPYTLNIKRKVYCYPISTIVDDYDYYRKKGLKIKKNGKVWGKKYFDVEEFNSYNGNTEIEYEVELPKYEDIEKLEDINSVLREYGYEIEDFNDYTRLYFSKKDLNYRERYNLITFLKNEVFLPKTTPKLIEKDKENMLKILKAILSEKKFRHHLLMRELKYIFKKNYKTKDKKLGFNLGDE